MPVCNILCIVQYMQAKQLLRDRTDFADGICIEWAVYLLPTATPERPHRLKYRLHCGRRAQCIVRYDNEQGKGDHRHYGEKEEAYRFVSYGQLLIDFAADVARLTGIDI